MPRSSIRSATIAAIGSSVKNAKTAAPERTQPGIVLVCTNSTMPPISATAVKSIARSSTSVPSAAEPRTSVSRPSSQGRASSPSRSGSTLIAMKPSAVARNSGRIGSGRSDSERASQRQRSARRYSASTCSGTIASTSHGFASPMCAATWRRSTPRSVKATAAIGSNNPTQTRQSLSEAQRARRSGRSSARARAAQQLARAPGVERDLRRELLRSREAPLGADARGELQLEPSPVQVAR